jgi:hypothetical protein
MHSITSSQKTSNSLAFTEGLNALLDHCMKVGAIEQNARRNSSLDALRKYGRGVVLSPEETCLMQRAADVQDFLLNRCVGVEMNESDRELLHALALVLTVLPDEHLSIVQGRDLYVILPQKSAAFCASFIPAGDRFVLMVLPSAIVSEPLSVKTGWLAHEIAHVVLGDVVGAGPYEESSADRLAAAWGFPDFPKRSESH